MAEKSLFEKEEIRAWTEEHGGEPCVIKGVREEEGFEHPDMLHICFDETLDDMEKIGWTEFFDRLDKENLALVYDEAAPTSSFRFIDREEAAATYIPDLELPDSGDEAVLQNNLVPDEPPEFGEEI